MPPKASLPLPDLFANQATPLPLDTKEGRLEVFVELDDPVSMGERVEIGFILRDAAGERSNDPSITLQAVENQR